MTRAVKYLIIGQGLAGSALAWQLLKKDESVHVIDQPLKNISSSVAAGIFNPVTGRVMELTWNAHVLFPYMERFYGDAENYFGQKLLCKTPVYRPFLDENERARWLVRVSGEMSEWVTIPGEPIDGDMINNPYGGIVVRHSGYLDVMTWIQSLRSELQRRNSFTESKFDSKKLSSGPPYRYENLVAENVIMCEGAKSTEFSWLPIKALKGEVLELELERPANYIHNRGVYLVPVGGKRFLAGATYQHPPFSEETSDGGRDQLKARLDSLLKTPYSIVHQRWGIRPTTPDRRPLLGEHPERKNLFIFNGLGTKGVSLAPYMAAKLADWMGGHAQLEEEVNITRFNTLYSGLRE